MNQYIRPSALTGAAGTYYVASRFAFQGFHAAITFGNAPTVDVLVSRKDGASTVALQVKTTAWALRTRGRGQSKTPHHYEWDVGYKTAHTARRDLFYALVDIKEFESLPDVFFVPSEFMVKWFSQWGELKRYRFHPLVEEVEQFKNNWGSIQRKLGEIQKV
jgi:hypothetical protein